MLIYQDINVLLVTRLTLTRGSKWEIIYLFTHIGNY